MPDRTDEVNLLIVDDLPENLLALDALGSAWLARGRGPGKAVA